MFCNVYNFFVASIFSLFYAKGRSRGLGSAISETWMKVSPISETNRQSFAKCETLVRNFAMYRHTHRARIFRRRAVRRENNVSFG